MTGFPTLALVRIENDPFIEEDNPVPTISYVSGSKTVISH